MVQDTTILVVVFYILSPFYWSTNWSKTVTCSMYVSSHSNLCDIPLVCSYYYMFCH
ncbi:hypothetical protein BDZ94DRAFT_1258435 [Collybia nuda]|uniref:Uncharacterized protein n=1 Tax=Collybia nuda TaxID=64659 RepID=A0A9P5Y7B6_9AGAR|nr:hypothetical protein BDZ94DRAFT_1258435 [Collybia nuda]